LKNKIKHAVILAAGRGIRMRPLTNKIPKAMAPFKGSTLINNSIEKIKNFFENIHVTVGYKGAILAKHVIEKNVSSIINTDGKGNSWWLYNSLLKEINEPICVFTCDNIIETNYISLLEEYINLKNPCCMLVPTTPIKGLEGDYIFADNDNIVTKISRLEKSRIYCSGIQLLNPYSINLKTKKVDDFNDVWNQLITIEELKISSTLSEYWYAIDNLEQLKFINDSE
tara:strand:- start:373 stop:1050 length:678 start_codon:yes stop_codon:yes gene_type:complete